MVLLGAVGMTQVVECLPSKHEFKPQYHQKKKEREREREREKEMILLMLLSQDRAISHDITTGCYDRGSPFLSCPHLTSRGVSPEPSCAQDIS
jgi:hypothetical protein